MDATYPGFLIEKAHLQDRFNFQLFEPEQAFDIVIGVEWEQQDFLIQLIPFVLETEYYGPSPSQAKAVPPTVSSFYLPPRRRVVGSGSKSATSWPQKPGRRMHATL